MNKITNKVTLIDTYNRNPKDYIEDFKLWCEDNDFTYKGENEDDLVTTDDYGINIKFMDWYYDNCQIEEQDFWETINESTKNYSLDCVVIGKLGLWNGNYNIKPTCMNMMDAIHKFLKDSMYYSISVDSENKTLIVVNMHHDGENVFELRLINGETSDKLVYWDDDIDGDINEFFKDKDNFEDFYFEYFGM